jgi:hypothetical protein
LVAARTGVADAFDIVVVNGPFAPRLTRVPDGRSLTAGV